MVSLTWFLNSIWDIYNRFKRFQKPTVGIFRAISSGDLIRISGYLIPNERVQSAHLKSCYSHHHKYESVWTFYQMKTSDDRSLMKWLANSFMPVVGDTQFSLNSRSRSGSRELSIILSNTNIAELSRSWPNHCLHQLFHIKTHKSDPKHMCCSLYVFHQSELLKMFQIMLWSYYVVANFGHPDCSLQHRVCCNIPWNRDML